MKLLIKFICLLFALFYLASCEKPDPIVDIPAPKSDIQVSAEVKNIVYTNDRNIKLDASNTDQINGRRSLSYSWICKVFPVGKAPKINGPSNAVTTIDSLMVGKYNFQLTVKDDFGHLVNAEFEMEVFQDTLTGAPKIVHIPDQTVAFPGTFILLGASLSYYANPSNRKLEFEWSILQKPAGNRDPTVTDKLNSSTYIRDLEPGNYQILLKITNEIGLSSYDTIRIKVKPAPVLTTREYEGTWVLLNDGWDASHLLIKISDPVNFAGQNEENITITVLNLETQKVLDNVGWIFEDNVIYLYYYDVKSAGTKAKVSVSYYQ